MVVLPTMLTLAAALALVFALFALYRSVLASLGGVEATALSSLASSEERIALLEQKAALLASLRDLHLDRDLDKVSEADFKPIDTRLRLEAKQVIQRLDDEGADYLVEADALIAKALKGVKAAAKGAESSGPKEKTGSAKADQQPRRGPEDATLAHGKHAKRAAANAVADAGTSGDVPVATMQAEDEAAAVTQARAVAGTDAGAQATPESDSAPRKVCGSCQGDNEPDARFCKHCGAKL